jgi:hypothetical protein
VLNENFPISRLPKKGALSDVDGSRVKKLRVHCLTRKAKVYTQNTFSAETRRNENQIKAKEGAEEIKANK